MLDEVDAAGGRSSVSLSTVSDVVRSTNGADALLAKSETRSVCFMVNFVTLLSAGGEEANSGEGEVGWR